MITRATTTRHIIFFNFFDIFLTFTLINFPRIFLFAVIPIFGVLTHKDRINENDEDYQTLEKDFKKGLTLPDNRFLLCTNYCDDYDNHHGMSRLDHRHPELDIPILKFMRQVSINCKPRQTVYKSDGIHTKYFNGNKMIIFRSFRLMRGAAPYIAFLHSYP